MSGGHFDYKQYEIRTIAESIQTVLDGQGKEIPKEDLYVSEEYLQKYPEERFGYTYPMQVQVEMRNAIKALRVAEVYAQRVDWMLSGDDGEDTFLERLNNDLTALNKELND